MSDDAYRARPTEYLAGARSFAAESTEPDLELSDIFGSAHDADGGHAGGAGSDELCDASSPQRSVRGVPRGGGETPLSARRLRDGRAAAAARVGAWLSRARSLARARAPTAGRRASLSATLPSSERSRA